MPKYRLFITSLLFFVLTASAVAQVAPTATLAGTVFDPSGAVLPEVALTLTNLDTGHRANRRFGLRRQVPVHFRARRPVPVAGRGQRLLDVSADRHSPERQHAGHGRRPDGHWQRLRAGERHSRRHRW